VCSLAVTRKAFVFLRFHLAVTPKTCCHSKPSIHRRARLDERGEGKRGCALASLSLTGGGVRQSCDMRLRREADMRLRREAEAGMRPSCDVSKSVT